VLTPLAVAGPSITELEIRYVTDAVRTGWNDRWNEYPARFEQAFADYLGVDGAISTPSCTSAIEVALATLGIGPGDEVIVPDITWVATATPVSRAGATPVFADINVDDWCISAASIEARITPRTRAVIAVDLYGVVPRMDEIRATCARHGLALIEDAAEAIGATYNGQLAGTFGDIGVFSFHGSKTLTTGEGGMLVTSDAGLLRRARILRDQGRDPDVRELRITEPGFKARMSSMQAALGLAQLERIEELLALKRAAFGWYEESLGLLPGVTLNPKPRNVQSTFWMVTAVLDPSLGLRKEEVMEALAAQSIESRPFFYPLSSMEAFGESPGVREAKRENPTAYSLAPFGVNLPSSLTLSRGDVARVADTVGALVRRARSRPSLTSL
jgi:perosamine synthetase